MDTTIFKQLVEAIHKQRVETCFSLLNHPPLQLVQVNPDNKEWYFVVLENNLSVISKQVTTSADPNQTLQRALQVTVKLANTYARREALLEETLKEINTVVQLEDPIATITALVEQNESLNGIPKRLLKIQLEDEVEAAMKLHPLALLIHEELRDATKEKGKCLNYDEMLAFLRALEKVIQLNEALSGKNDKEVLKALLSKDSLWENVLESKVNLSSLYFSKLFSKRNTKFSAKGESTLLTHAEIQQVVDEVAKTNRKEYKDLAISATENFGNEEKCLTKHANLEEPKPNRRTGKSKSPVYPKTNLTPSSVDTSDHYLALLRQNLEPGNEFRLWGWLQALKATGSLTGLKGDLSAENVDLYRRALRKLPVLTTSGVAMAVEKAHEIYSRAQLLGLVLAEINQALEEGERSVLDKQFMEFINREKAAHLKLRSAVISLDLNQENINAYVESLIKLRNAKLQSNCKGTAVDSTCSGDSRLVSKCGWLRTSLPHRNGENDHFYYNIKSGELIWRPSYTTPEPSCTDPFLLNREEIAECVNQVNKSSKALGDGLQNVTRPFPQSAFNILECLIRAFLVKRHHLEWAYTLNEGMEKICKSRELLVGIKGFQALWRGYFTRQKYAAYIATLNSPKLKFAAARIVTYIRHHRRRRMIERTLEGVWRILRGVRKAQAMWRGHVLRRALASSLSLALSPNYLSTSRRPLYWLGRLFKCALVPKAADNIYDTQLGCFHAAQKIEDQACLLVRLDNEIGRLQMIISLIDRVHHDACASTLKHKRSSSANCVSTATKCAAESLVMIGENVVKQTPEEQVGRRYEGLLFLLYTQPDYLARLFAELPSHLLWQEKPVANPEAYKASEFGLMLERIILSLYNYGMSLGDETSLLFLVIRILHLQVATSSWCAIMEERSHFALRLVVSMTHVSHSLDGKHAKTGISRLLPLLQEILSGDREGCKAKEGAGVPMPGGDAHSSWTTVKWHPTPPEVGHGSALKETRTTASAFFHKNKIRLFYENLPSTLPPPQAMLKVFDLSWLAHAAERFFYILFEESGGVILPPCLQHVMQEFFVLLRQKYPSQPVKEHVKFLGLHVFYRYIHSIIIAPDAFAQTHCEPAERAPLPTTGPGFGGRRCLAALSRLLCFVVENKGFVGKGTSGQQAMVFNPLIKAWHAKFKQYLLNTLNEKKPRRTPAGIMKRQVDGWIRRLPYAGPKHEWLELQPWRMEEAEDKKKTITLAVDELAELHRLINAYKEKIAPNAHDPLHIELEKIDRLPQVLFRHPKVNEDEENPDIVEDETRPTSNNKVTNHKAKRKKPRRKLFGSKLRSGSTSRLETFSLHDYMSLNKLSTPSFRCANTERTINTRASSLGQNSSNSHGPNLIPSENTDTFAHKPLLRYYRLSSGDSTDVILASGHQIPIAIQAISPMQFANACLYAVKAVGTRSTECFTFGPPDGRNQLSVKPLFGWAEPLPFCKASKAPFRRKPSMLDGGDVRNRPLASNGADGVAISEASVDCKSAPATAKVRELGVDWINAKREMIHIFSWIEIHKKCVHRDAAPEPRDGPAGVPGWLCLFLAWLARVEVTSETYFPKRTHSALCGDDFASIRHLQQSIHILQAAVTHIQAFFGLNHATIWHELLAAIIRDIFHFDAICIRSVWQSLGDRLSIVNNNLEDRIHRRRKAIAALNDFISTCLQPRPVWSSKFSIRTPNVVGVSLPFSYLVSHGIVAGGKCTLSDKQMRNMRLEIVAHLSVPGRFCLTVYLLSVQWEEPQELYIPDLLLQMHADNTTLPFFSEQLWLNLMPLVKMMFKKFYHDSLPSLSSISESNG
ncbi:unnamed protein product [Mesocestoides corti]|uniref:Ras-GAP domain-containing protein n=2 Tax=Mesocestoides corti TaxID=53468 RepID=A0A158QSN3_MESCO|nr:unnamed protein product [Mesocestoides corti]